MKRVRPLTAEQLAALPLARRYAYAAKLVSLPVAADATGLDPAYIYQQRDPRHAKLLRIAKAARRHA